jgi:hypothetical protein
MILRGRVTRIATGVDERIRSLYAYVSVDVTDVVKAASRVVRPSARARKRREAGRRSGAAHDNLSKPLRAAFEARGFLTLARLKPARSVFDSAQLRAPRLG